MVTEQLETFFLNRNYQCLPTTAAGIAYYYQAENTRITAVCLVSMEDCPDLEEAQLTFSREQAIATFRSRGFIESHILTLIVSEDIEAAKRLSLGNYFCWIIDANCKRLMVYENQIEDFYGLRKSLERFLIAVTTGNQALIRDQSHGKYVPWATLGLIAINVILFLACTFWGDLLYNKGAFSLYYLQTGREYYRLISSMFLHANLMHLVSNMILLFVVGKLLERYCGRIFYLILYFICGLAGSALSAAGEFYMGKYSASIGASGAIMGLIGALLAIVVYHRGQYKEFNSRRILFMIAYILYAGFTTTNVNNLAHIGGIIGGFIIMLFYCLIRGHMTKTKGDRSEN